MISMNGFVYKAEMTRVIMTVRHMVVTMTFNMVKFGLGVSVGVSQQENQRHTTISIS